MSFSDSEIAVASNGDGGGAASPDATGTPSATLNLSSVTQLNLGSDEAVRCLNGYVKELRFWPKSLTAAERNALTNN